jgi:hypothetical protein
LGGRHRTVAAGVLLAVCLVAVSACQVQTQVVLDATTASRGVVGVTVTLDAAATAAVGGRAALAAQLQDADLVAAGWTVRGPSAGPGSSTVISASHPYTDLAEAGALVGEVAGSTTGTASGRPFSLTLSEHDSFWQRDTRLSGEVNLSCGLGCFGDAGLQKALGSATGVNPTEAAQAAGEQPDQVFGFTVTAELPGQVERSDAAVQHGRTLQWDPRLGQVLLLSATTRSWRLARMVGIGVAGVVVLMALAGGLWWRWRRRRRRRRRQAQRRIAQTVTPRL